MFGTFYCFHKLRRCCLPNCSLVEFKVQPPSSYYLLSWHIPVLLTNHIFGQSKYQHLLFLQADVLSPCRLHHCLHFRLKWNSLESVKCLSASHGFRWNVADEGLTRVFVDVQACNTCNTPVCTSWSLEVGKQATVSVDTCKWCPWKLL